MTDDFYLGWRIRFRQNVHMYCHELTATKGDLELKISCEDMPAGPVGIWPYSLQLDVAVYEDLIDAIRMWAAETGLNYHLYVTKDRFEKSTEP